MTGEDSSTAITPRQLLWAYCQGYFPMGASRDDPQLYWFCPDWRAILPMEDLHCPRSLEKVIRQQRFELCWDRDFEDVIDACALPRPGEPNTWINMTIRNLFIALHHEGFAHCLAAYRAGRLVGGIYGLAIGRAFFAESMFCDREHGGTDASKVCLVELVRLLRDNGFHLFDVQYATDHLRRFGVIEIPREQYLTRLKDAIGIDDSPAAQGT